jgi:hypothetical protein
VARTRFVCGVETYLDGCSDAKIIQKQASRRVSMPQTEGPRHGHWLGAGIEEIDIEGSGVVKARIAWSSSCFRSGLAK